MIGRTISFLLLVIYCVCLANALLVDGQRGYENGHHNNKMLQQQHSSYKHGVGYGLVDSRYIKHGTKTNELSGGTCSEFLKINSLNQCCAHRDDDCYMIHYDTRCYCDVFCDRSKIPDNSDCCPDAGTICSGESMPPPVQQNSKIKFK